MKTFSFLKVFSGAVWAVLTLGVMGQSTIDSSSKYAWGENSGWINFRPIQPNGPVGIVFGESVLSGFAYSANTGWINFGDGAPSDHIHYSNSGSEHGVNHDGQGNLSGYAWAANTGWINFDWADDTDINRPYVDLLTGDFTGYVWSANTGWINLGTGLLTTTSMVVNDIDADGISDQWEWSNFGGLGTADATSDTDADGASDLAEYAADTNPQDSGQYLKIVSQAYNNGHTEITLEFTTTPTRLYRIEYSKDLGGEDAWQDSSLGIFSPDSGTSTTRVVTFTALVESKYFFRAVALRPLSP